jgi:protein-L-isoaspartate(D-aspartate) O-methyltransferase
MTEANMVQMNVEQARFNMVEQQVRPWEVLDQKVLDWLMATPREEFVPAGYRNLAFADIEIPLGHGQAMLSPKLEGRVLQAIRLQPTDDVLQVGVGSGYLTALLAKSAKYVWALETVGELAQSAQARLKAQGIENVTVETSDGLKGWGEFAPFEAIVLTGSVATVPLALRQQLSLGGRLFAVAGNGAVMQALLITRVSESEWHTEALFETVLSPLQGAAQPERFVF